MPESRQQRRARERAERNRAARPGPMRVVSPTAEPLPLKPAQPIPRIVDVDVYRYRADPDDPHDVDGWSAEVGLRDHEVGYAHEFFEDLGELVADVVDGAERWADEYDVTFAWMLDGSERSMHEAAASMRVTLPRRPTGT